MTSGGVASSVNPMVCNRLGKPNDIPYHVRSIYQRDREEHVSRQGKNGHLMLYGMGGEGKQCTDVRCVRYGTHHVLSLWEFGVNKATE